MKVILILLSLWIAFHFTREDQKKSIDNLELMAKRLNKSVPKRLLRGKDSKGFKINDGKPENFFVFDLIDTVGNTYKRIDPLVLKKDGIYHFSPVWYTYSFSHIAVIIKGEMKIFKFLNCAKGDSIEDVVTYIKKEGIGIDKNALERIYSYRNYGIYFKRDPQTLLKCRCPNSV